MHFTAGTHRIAPLLLLATLAYAPAAASQERQGEGDVPILGLVDTAAKLARTGIALEDARTVLGAAQLLIVAERPSAGLERMGGQAPGAPPGMESTEKGYDLTAASLLREATRIALTNGDLATAEAAIELAGNAEAGLADADLAEVLEEMVGASGARGALGGPIWAEYYLYPGGWVDYNINFQGGYVPNWVNVWAGNGYADLDCYIYDSGRLVVWDERHWEDCSAEWDQRWTGTMTLRILNRGAGSNLSLRTN